MSIIERSEDKECRTFVKKNFLYVVNKIKTIDEKNLSEPEIHIRKVCDSRTKIEVFQFKVRGSFYIAHEDNYFKVNFCHHLHIQLNWKTKTFSPKPVTLT